MTDMFKLKGFRAYTLGLSPYMLNFLCNNMEVYGNLETGF